MQARLGTAAYFDEVLVPEVSRLPHPFFVRQPKFIRITFPSVSRVNFGLIAPPPSGRDRLCKPYHDSLNLWRFSRTGIGSVVLFLVNSYSLGEIGPLVQQLRLCLGVGAFPDPTQTIVCLCNWTATSLQLDSYVAATRQLCRCN